MATSPTNNKDSWPTPEVIQLQAKIDQDRKRLAAIQEERVQRIEQSNLEINDTMHQIEKLTKKDTDNSRKNLRKLFWVVMAGLLVVGVVILIDRRMQVLS